MTTEQPTEPAGVVSSDGLCVLPEPAAFRTRYRSEPGMIGHYPWTYADQRRRMTERPECEYQDLYTADQVLATLAAERGRIKPRLAQYADNLDREGEDSRAVRAFWALLCLDGHNAQLPGSEAVRAE